MLPGLRARLATRCSACWKGRAIAGKTTTTIPCRLSTLVEGLNWVANDAEGRVK